MAPVQHGMEHTPPLPEPDIIPPIPAPVENQDPLFHWVRERILRRVVGAIECVAPLVIESHPVATVENPAITQRQRGAQPVAVAAPAPLLYAPHHQGQQVRIVYRVRPGRALWVMTVAVMIFASLLSITHVSAANLAFSVDASVEIVMGDAARADEVSWVLASGLKSVAIVFSFPSPHHLILPLKK